jgi:hypothetical protein
MIKKIIFIIISFLIGIVIFIPYEKVYTLLLDAQIIKYQLPITFKIKSATPLSIIFSSVCVLGKGDRANPQIPFKIDDCFLTVNPISCIINGSIALITTNNVKININKEDNLWRLNFNINDFSNQYFGDTIININGYAYLSNITKDEKKIQLNIDDVKLITQKRSILLNDIKGNFIIKNNIITIDKLKISGIVNISIDGRLIILANNLQDSQLNIQYQFRNIDKVHLDIKLKDTADWFMALKQDGLLESHK